jgi:hypothetical protein
MSISNIEVSSDFSLLIYNRDTWMAVLVVLATWKSSLSVDASTKALFVYASYLFYKLPIPPEDDYI